MIRASVIAAIFLIPFAAAATVDSEPPVFTFCPGDILIDNATELQMRISWQRPYASDNSGVPPAIYSNREAGALFSVPGSYEIVYKAVDGSGNEATCSFRITLQKKTCLLYPPPKNGALSCQYFGGDPMCQVQCKVGFDFGFTPPIIYLCSNGIWSPLGIPPYGSRLPWPDCSSTAKESEIFVPARPYFFFSGDCSDPSTNPAIKQNFIGLLNQPYMPPKLCEKCSEANIDVYCGNVTAAGRRRRRPPTM